VQQNLKMINIAKHCSCNLITGVRFTNELFFKNWNSGSHARGPKPAKLT